MNGGSYDYQSFFWHLPLGINHMIGYKVKKVFMGLSCLEQ